MRKLWLGLAGIAVVIAAVLYARSGNPPAAAAAPPTVLVSTIKLAPGALPATVTAYGVVAAGPGAQTTIGLQAPGIIRAIAVMRGEAVAAGAPLASIAPDAQSVADLQRAMGALAAAKINRAHVAALLAAHLATNADLAVAAQTERDAAGALAALQAMGTGAAKTITAPFPGIIAAVLAAPGAALPAGAPLLQILQPAGLVAQLGVPPDQAAGIKPGAPAVVSLLNTNLTMSGQVTLVASALDPQTGLQPITLSMQGAALPGAGLSAVITTGSIAGYVVPRDSVQTDAQGAYAFQLDSNNIAHRIAVQVLGSSGDQTVIAPNLNTAMPFVTQGAYQLDDGMAVRITP